MAARKGRRTPNGANRGAPDSRPSSQTQRDLRRLRTDRSGPIFQRAKMQKVKTKVLETNEFYERILAGEIPGDGSGRPPFVYRRFHDDRTSQMILYGAPLLHFKILQNVDGRYLVKASYDPALPIEGAGESVEAWIIASNVDELHKRLEGYGEAGVRIYSRRSAEACFRRTRN